MRISGTEPSSVILSQTGSIKNWKLITKKCQNKLKPNINPQNYNFNRVSFFFEESLRYIIFDPKRVFNLSINQIILNDISTFTPVTYITEISLIVTLRNQLKSPGPHGGIPFSNIGLSSWKRSVIFLNISVSYGYDYCFTPYQRLWLYNGAPYVAFYDTLRIRRTYSQLKPPASSRGISVRVRSVNYYINSAVTYSKNRSTTCLHS